jgi:hypothetical protein
MTHRGICPCYIYVARQIDGGDDTSEKGEREAWRKW